MHILLDTHTAIWYGDDPQRIPSSTLALLNDPDNIVFVSIASRWKPAIKQARTSCALVWRQISITNVSDFYGFALLPIMLQHIAVLQMLPLHHRNPFDRLLFAQSISDGLALVSADAVLAPMESPRFGAERILPFVDSKRKL